MVYSLRNWLFVTILFSMFYASANSSCVQFYTPSEEVQRQAFVANFENRLASYFGARWENPRPYTDVDAAKTFLRKLSENGTLLDFKFFDLYLAVLENTSGKYELRTGPFYLDTWMEYRPKSNFFQERHWDWYIIDGYFFNAPLPVSLIKEVDFKYMNHVLATAKQMGKVPLRDVLQRANHEWALKTIAAESEIGRQYSAFVQNKPYSVLFSEFKAKVNQWIGTAPTAEQRQVRKAAAQAPMMNYKISNSALDLFIINKYFNLLLKYGVADKPFPHEKIILWMQLTNWNVFEMALPYSSMHYMNDFLFQNSHDIVAKKFLLKILNELDSMEIRVVGDAGQFYFNYLKARWKAEEDILSHPRPSQYQTDLHIFAKRITDGSGYHLYDRTVVSWNPVLGRPQANVIDHHSLDGKTPPIVGSVPELNRNIKQYFDQLRENKSFTEAEISRDENLELNTPLANTTYLSFTKSTTDQMLTLVRLFDGTASPTYIEREFPHISLPRYKDGRKTIEVGRLLAKGDVEVKSIWPIMARVAEYLKMANYRGEVYFDCNPAAMKYYKSLGAEIVYNPEQLKIGKEQTQMWVMKFSISDIIRIFSTTEYQSVKYRTSRSRNN